MGTVREQPKVWVRMPKRHFDVLKAYAKVQDKSMSLVLNEAWALLWNQRVVGTPKERLVAALMKGAQRGRADDGATADPAD